MALTKRMSAPRTGSRWARSRRSASPEDAAKIRALLDDAHPGFWTALTADVEVTARFRGERHELGSRAEVVAQAVRLAWITDSFLAQVCYRAKVAARGRGIPLLPAVLHRLAIVLGQVAIGDQVVVRPGLYLPHGQVVIDGLTHVGRGVVIRPFVTLGLRDGYIFGPNIGDRTHIGTGAKVFGPVRIGTNVQIGANAVVNHDVPDGATAVGVPARVVG